MSVDEGLLGYQIWNNKKTHSDYNVQAHCVFLCDSTGAAPVTPCTNPQKLSEDYIF